MRRFPCPGSLCRPASSSARLHRRGSCSPNLGYSRPHQWREPAAIPSDRVGRRCPPDAHERRATTKHQGGVAVCGRHVSQPPFLATSTARNTSTRARRSRSAASAAWRAACACLTSSARLDSSARPASSARRALSTARACSASRAASATAVASAARASSAARVAAATRASLLAVFRLRLAGFCARARTDACQREVGTRSRNDERIPAHAIVERELERRERGRPSPLDNAHDLGRALDTLRHPLELASNWH